MLQLGRFECGLQCNAAPTVYTIHATQHVHTRCTQSTQHSACTHNAQDAKLGLKLDSLPPVLQLQLKRFEFDYQRDAQTKVGRVASCARTRMCSVVVDGLWCPLV